MAAAASVAGAAPVQWTTASGGNGHYYEAVFVGASGITWAAAEADAVARGGHLASVTSAAENAFVYSLVSDPSWWHSSGGGSYVGPWIGGTRPTTSTTAWGWTDGSAWAYTNWAASQPTNTNGNEYYVHYIGAGTTPADTWNDLASPPPGGWAVTGYVVETVPEPTGVVMAGAAALVLGRRRAKR
ncbi:MAG: lectin-like protein [Phycisphaerae bacterium]|nr:lectin-like protein [Tepidisphaeraceae bacterium]